MVKAKPILVKNIKPATFIIEIVDDELKPIAGVKFSVAVGGNVITKETDNKGMLKVPKKKGEIKLSLAGEEVIATGEVPAGEVETPVPLKSPKATPSMPAEPLSVADSPSASPTPENKILSGRSWVSKPNTSIYDLEPTFGAKVKKFISSLESAGANVDINATKRSREQAYLMLWSWKIVKENHDASKIPPHEEVNINWWHGDQPKSKAAAQDMVNGYSISNLKVAPSLKSRHIEGKAIDMNISWSGDLKIKKNDNSEVTITTSPRDGTNSELIKVGATYGMIHFKDVEKDKPHWSIDGK